MYTKTLIAFIALAGFTTTAFAATTYNSVAAFDAALGASSVVLDDLNDISPGGFDPLTLPIDRGDYSLTNKIGQVWGAAGATPNSIDGTAYLLLGINGFGGPGGFTVSLDQPVDAFAFEYDSSGSPAPTLRVSTDSFSQDLVIQPDSPALFGVIFDNPTSEITFFNQSGQNFIGIDNFRVPEPTSLTLLALGGLALLRRR